jgi:hypothetical protein
MLREAAAIGETDVAAAAAAAADAPVVTELVAGIVASVVASVVAVAAVDPLEGDGVRLPEVVVLQFCAVYPVDGVSVR